MSIFSLDRMGRKPDELEAGGLQFDPQRGDYVQSLSNGEIRFTPEDAVRYAKTQGLSMSGMGMDLRDVKAPAEQPPPPPVAVAQAGPPPREDLTQTLMQKMGDPTYQNAIRGYPEGDRMLEAYGTSRALAAQPSTGPGRNQPGDAAQGDAQARLDEAARSLQNGTSVDVGPPQLLARTPDAAPPAVLTHRPSSATPSQGEEKLAPPVPMDTGASAPRPPPPATAPSGQPTRTSDMGLSGLLGAQQAASQGQMFANLGRAGAMLTDALSTGVNKHGVVHNAPVDQGYYDNLAKSSQQPLQAYAQQQAAADQQKKEAATKALGDPNSPKNARARQALASMIPGIEKRPGFNSLLETDIPNYLSSEKIRSEMDDKAKKEVDRQRGLERSDAALAETVRHNRYSEAHPATGMMLNVRKDALVGRLADTMTKQLDEGQWQGPIAKQVEARNQAQHLSALAHTASGNINNLDSREQEELAMGFARLISGGHGSEGEVKTLVPPKTLQSGAAGIVEWLKNEPQGRNQVEFVRRMAHSVERQQGVAQGLIDQEKAKRAGSHRKLQELDPEQHQAVLEGAGMDASHFDAHGVYRAPAATTGSAEQKTVGGKTYEKRGDKWFEL